MAIKSTLAKSSVIVFITNWIILTLVFAFYNVEKTQDVLDGLGMLYDDLNNYNLIHAQILIGSHWIPYAASAVFVSATIAFCLAWSFALLLDYRRSKRFEGRGEYRGLRVSIGTLPYPKKKKAPPLLIELPLGEISENHQSLLNEIFALIKENNVPAGMGHGNDLFTHTVNVVNKAIELNKSDPNLICALAGHDLGKIETFIKGDLKEDVDPNKKDKHMDDYKWEVKGKHDEVGARIVALMESWWDMEERDKNIIFYAIKYSHKPSQLPTSIAFYDDVCKCLEDLRHVDHNVTGIEKEEMVEEMVETKTLLEYFKQFLQETPIRTNNTAVGQKCGGWVKHGKIFVLENYFKDKYLKENHPEVLASYNELSKSKQYSKLTKDLLNQLNEEGILVKEWNELKIRNNKDALWVIKAGKAEFGKVIIVNLTEELVQFVGTSTYNQGVSVISTYGKYLREKQKTTKNVPKANVKTTDSTQSKITNDLNKIKQQQNTHNKEATNNSTNNDNTDQPNKQVSEKKNAAAKETKPAKPSSNKKAAPTADNKQNNKNVSTEKQDSQANEQNPPPKKESGEKVAKNNQHKQKKTKHVKSDKQPDKKDASENPKNTTKPTENTNNKHSKNDRKKSDDAKAKHHQNKRRKNKRFHNDDMDEPLDYDMPMPSYLSDTKKTGTSLLRLTDTLSTSEYLAQLTLHHIEKSIDADEKALDVSEVERLQDLDTPF